MTLENAVYQTCSGCRQYSDRNELIQVKTFHQNYASKYGSGNGAGDNGGRADELTGRFFKIRCCVNTPDGNFPILRMFPGLVEEYSPKQ